MQKYAMLLSYSGTKYCGWQRQKGSAAGGAHSIQATLEDVLHQITGEKFAVVGSGRTDAGVHATGQVAHFILKEKIWEEWVLSRGLNSLLSRNIQVLALQKVPMEFHAQRSATKKQYSYYFQQGPAALPHLEPYSWWIRKRLDLVALEKALSYLKGQHDFKAFQSSGAKPGPTVREIIEAEVSLEQVHFPGTTPLIQNDIGLVRIRLVGTGFLKQMVRGIAGTLLQVGERRREPECIREIIEAKKRSGVGPTAPGRALWLEQVWYPELNWN